MHYRYDNVITLRTFSKAYGLAGIRIGYGFAHHALIGNLMKVKLPFEPSSLAQAAGVAALEDEAFLRKTLAGTAEGLKTLRGGLAELGQTCLPSRTNFLAVETAGPAACRKLCERLLARGVIVRGLASFGFPSHFRVTVGTAEENAIFLNALKEALAEVPVGSAAG
jgi:histidinol-phosphate aminotransferase